MPFCVEVHWQVAESILAKIHRAEVESRARIIEARRAAEEMIEEARRQAVALRRAGEVDAEAAARQLHELELNRTHREVEEIEAEHLRRAEALTSAAELVPELARRVVAAVAPGGERDSGSPSQA